MGIRLKLFILFFAFGFVPMLALNIVNYLYGVSAVEAMLKSDATRDTSSIARNVEMALRDREAELKGLARSTALRDYMRAGGDVPEEVASQVRAFFFLNQKYYAAITCLDQRGKVLFRLEPSSHDGETVDWSNLRLQTSDFPSGIAQPDARFLKAADLTPLPSNVESESYGAGLHYTFPIVLEKESANAPRGALVADIKLDRIFKESVRDVADAEASALTGTPRASSRVVIIDRNGRIIYYTNYALKFQPVSSALPSFKPVADAMTTEGEGSTYYRAPDGDQLLAVFQRIATLNLSLATSRDYSLATGGLKRAGWISLAAALLVGLLAALVLTAVVRRTARSIERVTEGAVAIAAGDLDQRIEVRSSDETHLLAESFNAMTAKLREQMAREAETRQFESFLRLSAMLTHDLKNAIASLSLLVRNMEHQFHKEEFRADAMRSLTEATDKLRNLVSKLSEPVRSMSGEFGLPRPTDLVPIIRRVLNVTAGPYATRHKIETLLPEKLIASVDAERMEKVVENLVLNAFEAMGAEAGTLTVDAGEAADEKVFFGVRDTGPGMSEDFIRNRLFRPFATTKRKGVGLGLYTCREVVRAHGGEIGVESQKGIGTYFRVVLPSKQITDRKGT
ncbi:MAG: HAMP domain-containing protein [Pyrinomonadaceae bacterium]|nr:HAMP domain-containing protein [Pyrinomonadaceae bacterium]